MDFTLDDILEFDLLKAGGLQDAPDEEKKIFLEKIGKTILAGVIKRVQATLPPKKRQEFDILFSEDAPEEKRAAFLKNEVPDFEQFIIEEVLKFRAKEFQGFANGKN